MKPTKNRWLIAAAAVGIHISIGSVYAYSAWKMPLENTFGWKATQTTLAFSIAIFFLGLSAAFLGKVIERKGPRVGGLLSACFFSVGLLGSALACHLENLMLFYVFFGGISGIGLGLGYISPVSTLVKWFPDRRGLATGLAIMGFGFGGLVCAKLIDVFVPKRAEVVVPMETSAHDVEWAEEAVDADPAAARVAGLMSLEEYVSLRAAYEQHLHEGTTSHPAFSELKAPLRIQEEVKVGDDGEESAHYRLGVKSVVLYGKSTIVLAFLVLGGLYFIVMVPSALYIEPPPAGYADHFAASTGRKIQESARELTAMEAVRTPGFYGLWLMLFLNVSCGIAVIATAKKMGYEMVHLPVELASLLVMGISLFNGLGRILWASLSDTIGRANTYIAFFAIQILAFPALAHLGNVPVAFMAVTFLILTCYGGGFSCIPAYISDLFGLKEMPTIHGFILTAWSMAGLVGPMLNSYVYEKTNSYQLSLYIFGGVFVFALLISILMKFEVKRVG